MKTVSAAKVAPQASIAPNKTAIYFMAVLVCIVMLAWIGFLGWGIFAVFHWTLDVVRNGFSNPGGV